MSASCIYRHILDRLAARATKPAFHFIMLGASPAPKQRPVAKVATLPHLPYTPPMSRAAAKETAQELTTHVALLRGINVGGKNKLPMADLASIFVQSGCANVQTYIQSGNVIFKSANAKGLADRVAEVIDMRFGFNIPVVLRTAEEWSQVAKAHPLAKSHAEPDSLHVAFLVRRPDERKVAALDPARSPGDTLLIRDREVYLLLPNGVAKSKLTNAYFDSALGTTCTIRNWRTVQAIAEMLLGARMGAA